MFGFGQKELSDVSKYEQGIPIQRVDMNTGLDKYVKRKESDYKRDVTRDNPWRYDMSINLDAKVMHEEADDYFRKNIPDYTFLFAWNHKDEIFKKEKDFKGKWFSHVSL